MRIRLLFLIAGASSVLVTGCRKAETRTVSASEPAPVPVSVLQVQAQPFTATIAVTGTVISNSRVDVKAETTGRLLKFPKEEGDRVAAGEAVAWVERENYELAIRQAQSAVQVAEATLGRAKVMESHSRSELDRARNLIKSGGITDKDLKAAELAEQDTRAQSALADAQLAQARAALDTANKRLRDTVIHAPVAGEIQKKHVNPGAYVEPPTAVLTIVDNTRLEIESLVPTSDLAPIRSGQKVVFTVNAFPGTTFEGRVIELNPAVDTDSRSAKIRIGVDNRSGKLKAGMFAQGEILTGVASQAIVVPASAVYRDDRSAKESYVFVAENGKAARRKVFIGREREDLLEIARGLKPGDTLIAEQSIELAEGVRVAPRK